MTGDIIRTSDNSKAHRLMNHWMVGKVLYSFTLTKAGFSLNFIYDQSGPQVDVRVGILNPTSRFGSEAFWSSSLESLRAAGCDTQTERSLFAYMTHLAVFEKVVGVTALPGGSLALALSGRTITVPTYYEATTKDAWRVACMWNDVCLGRVTGEPGGFKIELTTPPEIDVDE